MTKAIKLRVNGETYRLDTDPDAPLLQILRNDLGLKAAKFGCGLEQCGACKVLIDGQAAPSCATPVSAVGDAKITTLEGLGTPADLHPPATRLYRRASRPMRLLQRRVDHRRQSPAR